MKRYVFLFCSLLCFCGIGFSQVKDDIPDATTKPSKGFFSFDLGANSLGYLFSGVSYNHTIGYGYLGFEISNVLFFNGNLD